MASIFNTGVAPQFTTEQRKQRNLCWKPNSVRLKLQTSGAAVTLLANPDKLAKAQAALEAKQARRVEGLAKAAATRAANKAAKLKSKKA